MTNEEEVKEIFGDDNQWQYVVGSIVIMLIAIGVFSIVGYLLIK